jgi:hypothetical protein
MKYLRMVFGLAVVAGLMAVAASPALAVKPPRWVTCLQVTGGHWKDANCESPGVGNWDTREITETQEITTSGRLELTDSAAPGGKTVVVCEGTDQGTVGAEGQGSTTRVTVTISSCKFVNKAHGGCEESKPIVEVKAVNLPWSTHLEERENTETKKIELRSLLRSLSGKPPGWAVTCETFLGPVTDECTGGSSTAVESARSNLLTNFIFDKASEQEPANCTQAAGKTGTGRVRGTVSSSLRNSKGVLVSLWVLASVLGT